MLQAAQDLERCYTRQQTYNACNVVDHDIASGRYFIDVSPLGQSFTITAVPQGAQEDDTACGTLSIDQRGRQDRSGTAALEECWRK